MLLMLHLELVTVAKNVVTSGSAANSNLNVGKLIAAKKALMLKMFHLTTDTS